MPVNEKFLAARAAEHRQRLLTHAGLAAPIELPILHREGVVARARVVPLTERHRLELALVGNAILCGRAPLLGDIMQFLWRLNPYFRRPDGTYPNLTGPVPIFFTWLRSRVARAALARAVRRCDLFAAERAIHEWLQVAEQDGHCGVSAKVTRSRLTPEHCYPDDLTNHLCSTYTIAPTQVLDLSVALVNQLWRAELLTRPNSELSVSAPSDALLSEA